MDVLESSMFNRPRPNRANDRILPFGRRTQSHSGTGRNIHGATHGNKHRRPEQPIEASNHLNSEPLAKEGV